MTRWAVYCDGVILFVECFNFAFNFNYGKLFFFSVLSSVLLCVMKLVKLYLCQRFPFAA
jgi:hypothetical protein